MKISTYLVVALLAAMVITPAASAQETRDDSEPQLGPLSESDPTTADLEWVDAGTWTSDITGNTYTISKRNIRLPFVYTAGPVSPYRYDGPGGVFGNVLDIIDAEIDASGITPHLFKADKQLRDLHASASLALVDMIVVLAKQPVLENAPGVWADYDPLINAKKAELDTETDPAAISQIHQDIEDLWSEAIDEMMSESSTEITIAQSTALAKLTAAGFVASELGRTLNTMFVTGAPAFLDDLTALDEIVAVSLDTEVVLDLNNAVDAINMNSFTDNGKTGQAYDIAVIDSGIDTSHPALDALSFVSETFHDHKSTSGCESATSTDDTNGHGTHIAGIIASEDSTYIGVLPTGWSGTIFNAKAALNCGGSLRLHTSDTIAAMEWASARTGDKAEVLSMSLSSYTGTASHALSLYADAIAKAHRHLVVTSSGNSNCNGREGAPQSAFNELSVGATNDANTDGRSDDSIHSDTCHVTTSDGRTTVDVLAVGAGVRSAAYDWEGGLFGSNANFVSKSGTSYSTPAAAAAAVMMFSEGFTDPKEVKMSLMNGADKDFTGGGGRVNSYGHGYLDMGQTYSHYSVNDFMLSGTVSTTQQVDYYRLPSPIGSDDVTLLWERDMAINSNPPSGTAQATTDLDLDVYDESSNVFRTNGGEVANNYEHVRGDDFVASADNVIKVSWVSSTSSAQTSESYVLGGTWTLQSFTGPVITATTPNAPTRVAWDGAGTISTTVTNTGDLRAHNVRVFLSIPGGWQLTTGSTMQTIGALNAGASTTVSWTVERTWAACGSGHTFQVQATSVSYGESLNTLWQARNVRLNCPPSVTWSSPAAGTYHRGTIFPTWSRSDSDGDSLSSTMRLDGATVCTTTGSSCSVNTASYGDGTHSFSVSVSDSWDTRSASSGTMTFDNTNPVLSISASGTQGNPPWYLSFVTVSASCSDATSGVQTFQYRINSGSWQTYVGSFTVSLQGTTVVDTRCIDRAGNTNLDSVTLRIDTLDPDTDAIYSGTTGNNGWFRSTVTTTLACTDPSPGSTCDTTFYKRNSESFQQYTGAFLVSGDGQHTVQYYSTDVAGNQETHESDAVKIDASPPSHSMSIAGTMGSGGWYVSSVTVSLSCSDATSGVGSREYQINGGPWQSYFSSFLVSTQGTTMIDSRCFDLAGNEATDNRTFNIDTIDPDTDASHTGTPAENGWYKSTVDTTLSCSDHVPGSGCASTTYRLDFGAWAPYSGTITTSTQGTHTLEYRSTDSAGNVEASESDQLKLDWTPPTVSMSSPAEAKTKTTFTVSWSGSDVHSGYRCTNVEYRENNGPWQPWKSCAAASSSPFTGAEGNTYNFRAQGRDWAGILSSWPASPQTSTYINIRPIADAGPDQSVTMLNNVLSGVSFDGSSSHDPDGTVIQYCWEFGDELGGSSCSSNPSATYSYGAPGSYSVVLTVTDDDGHTGTDTMVVTVTAL